MQDLKISLITVSFNAENTIRRCIESVIGQTYRFIEYIIIDGGSTDATLDIIGQYKDDIDIIISEPDGGIYDAMNKGIKLSTGSIIGMLNADDCFADEKVLITIAETFQCGDVDIIYGDLDYVNTDEKIIRKWRSGSYSSLQFNLGWMPPHPTFYCKKEIFNQFGLYSLDYGTAADYELMLRIMHFNAIKALYVKKVFVRMIIGGISNKSYRHRVKGLFFDLKAMRTNGIVLPLITIVLKPLRKIVQYF